MNEISTGLFTPTLWSILFSWFWTITSFPSLFLISLLQRCIQIQDLCNTVGVPKRFHANVSIKLHGQDEKFHPAVAEMN